LQELKQALDDSLARLGYAPETRPFHAHLTLGRVKQFDTRDRRHLAAALEREREREFGPWSVERVDLMRSILSPGGAKYETVRSFQLRPPTAA
jgi:2'-5' RNA ligase